MTNDEKLAILEEIVALTSPPLREATDITAQEYAERVGVSRGTAALRLNKLVERGILVSKRVYDPEAQRVKRVWRKVDSCSDGE